MSPEPWTCSAARLAVISGWFVCHQDGTVDSPREEVVTTTDKQ